MASFSIVDEHYRRNWTTRERWGAMMSHRERVMRVLSDARGQAVASTQAGASPKRIGNRMSSLCMLGVGNGNDIDLVRLADEFERIVFVDLDQAALERAVMRLENNTNGHIECCCPFDLTGILPELQAWLPRRQPADAELLAVMQSAQVASRPEIGTFDLVASTCVLTQLIDSVYMALPTEHPKCVDLVIAVRNRHLELILELLNPGGVGVLLTDFVATETAPELAQLNEMVLPQAAMKWIKERNFFTGANPFAIRDYYNRSRPPGPFAQDVQVKGPWRWDIGAKQLAVCAVTFRRGTESGRLD
jgi:hypothetical protein